MQTTVNDAIKQLEDCLNAEGVNEFETTALVRHGEKLKEIRIALSNGKMVVKKQRADGVTMDSEPVSDLLSGFVEASDCFKDATLLVDTIAIKTGAKHYLGDEEHLCVLANAAWSNCFPQTKSSVLKIEEALIKQLEKALQTVDKFQTSIWIRDRALLRELEFTAYQDNGFNHIYLRESPHVYSGQHYRAPTIASALATIVHYIDGRELLLDTAIVFTNRINNSSIADEEAAGNDPLNKLILNVWAAIAGTTDYTREAKLKPKVARNTIGRAMLLDYLAVGRIGVQSWNSTPEKVTCCFTFDELDLSNYDLTALKFGATKFRQCNFGKATMPKVEAQGTDLSRSAFRSANLSGSVFTRATLDGADFGNANLKKSKFRKCCLKEVSFAGAQLQNTDFTESDIRGADFSSCDLETCKFSKATYDESTKFPSDYSTPGDLRWSGTGPDPVKLLLLQQIDEKPSSFGFPKFLELIKSDFDSARVSKALTMLKKDRFQLFCEQNDSGVWGIIKSQTDEDLLYACKLGTEGTFACCTQNLNPCGGLRGALCKHILCLVIGLTKASEMDPAATARRVIASLRESATLDKDRMAALFLRYAGAQNGELDWRPTETLPEDYYAF